MTDLDPPRQIVIVHEEVWQALEAWAAEHNLDLLHVPVEGDLPTYIFSPARPR